MREYQSQDITKLAKALLSVQRVLQPAVKDSVNPFVKNRYASLNSIMEVCREPLLDHGIWLCQFPVPIENGADRQSYANFSGVDQQENFQQNHCLGLVTKLTHAESGQWQSSLTVIPLSKADPQSMGCAITYARRYALSAMLGIVTEEDTDGEMGKNNAKNRQNSNNSPQSNLRQNSSKAKANNVNQLKVSQNQNYEAKKIEAQENFNHLPILNGIVYESIGVQDDKGQNREVITANGNTIPNKDQLMKVGFKWNPSKKVWWKYAESS